MVFQTCIRLLILEPIVFRTEGSLPRGRKKSFPASGRSPRPSEKSFARGGEGVRGVEKCRPQPRSGGHSRNKSFLRPRESPPAPEKSFPSPPDLPFPPENCWLWNGEAGLAAQDGRPGVGQTVGSRLSHTASKTPQFPHPAGRGSRRRAAGLRPSGSSFAAGRRWRAFGRRR